MTERQSGQTTRQMLSAPKGALFFWCNDQTDYPRALATALQRKDLRILSASELRIERLHGYSLDQIVLDHALVVQTSEQRRALERAR